MCFYLLISMLAKPGKEIPKEHTYEVSVPNKLAALRSAFPRSLSIHKYLDTAPVDVIHALYTIHITGTSVNGPQPIKQAAEIFSALLLLEKEDVDQPSTPHVVPPPNVLPTCPIDSSLELRLKKLEEMLQKQSGKPTSTAVFKSAESPSLPPPTTVLKSKKSRSYKPLQFQLAYESRQAVPDEIVEQAKKKFVSIRSDSRFFHGIRLKNSKVATVYHGIRDSKIVSFNGSNDFTPTKIENYPDKDLSILTLDRENAATFHIRPSPVQSHEQVHLFVFNGDIVTVSGTVKYSDADVVVSNLITRPGCSGAALVDSRGALVGMHQSSDGQNAIALPALQILPHLN
jgi:hypothetical protein